MSQPAGTIQTAPFGATSDGTPVTRYCLTSESGVVVSLLTYGAILHDFRVPERDRGDRSITLSFNTIEDYETRSTSIGRIIGPYAGRIRNARIGDLQLIPNHGPHLIHGGDKGLHQSHFSATPTVGDESVSVAFHYCRTRDNDGYPGSMDITVTYELFRTGALDVRFKATSKEETWINLTHHAYFNLSDEPFDTIDGHHLMVPSDRLMVQDTDGLPIGTFTSPGGTDLDFQSSRQIAETIVDHDYALETTDDLTVGAILSLPGKKRQLTVLTDQPSMHVYTGDNLKPNKAFPSRMGVCLEAQDFPDAPNQPMFPSTTLLPGAVYERTIRFVYEDL